MYFRHNLNGIFTNICMFANHSKLYIKQYYENDLY